MAGVMGRVQAVFAGVLLWSLTAFLLWNVWRQWRLRRTIAEWPRVDGQVLGHDMHRARRHYRPLLRVRYHAGARTLVRVIDSPMRSGYNRSTAAQRVLDRHPVGSRVKVWVNPDDPEVAWWSLPERYLLFAQVLGALLFGVAGVAAAWPT